MIKSIINRFKRQPPPPPTLGDTGCETFAALGRSRSKAGKAQKETNRKNVHEILGRGRK